MQIDDKEKCRRLDKAKNDDEIKLCQALAAPSNDIKYKDIVQIVNEDIDKRQHIDVLAKRMEKDGNNFSLRLFDVKAAESNTGNFSISEKCKQNIELCVDRIYDFAFRLWKGGIETDSFLIVDAYEVIKNCPLKPKTNKNGKLYYLVSERDIRGKCRCHEVGPDVAV